MLTRLHSLVQALGKVKSFRLHHCQDSVLEVKTEL